MITPYLFSFLRKLVLLFVMFSFFTTTVIAQKVGQFNGERISTNYETDLESVFLDYDIFQIESSNMATYVRENAGKPMMLNLNLGSEYDWQILLYENDLMNENYAITEHTDNGNIISNRGSLKTLSGHLQANQGGMVHLTINDHFLMGMVHHGSESYFIEPLKGLVSDAPQDLFIVYNTKSVVPNTTRTCGVNDVAKYSVQTGQETNIGSQMDPCSELEMALAADESMVDKYGSVSDVEDYLIGVWNLVAPDYIGWFSQDIEFNIVTIFVVTGTDPWTSTTDASSLLDDFRTWGNQGNFGVNFDLGQLWSDRNFTNDDGGSVVGLAYLGVVCTNARYSIIEDFSNNSNSIRQTVTHEVGHNFDAVHNSPSTGDIMDPTVNGATTWSANSIADISAHIDSRTCFEDCLVCLEITSFEVQNCGGGTYDLEVCIEHVGRSNQSNLQITANGATSTFGFNSSGEQCETISGLLADGTLNAVLTVEDSNDNDVECTKTATYEVPHPQCFCSAIISENFDALSLPAGWTNVGSGNNPNGEWDFGNATVGDNTAAGSFDGSGMAFWDDDGNGPTQNGSEFMELTTPEVDITNFEMITLDFDYNFFTLNNGTDFFFVDVWNGNSWINLITVDETNCGPWGCDYPHYFGLMDQYANPAFKIRFTYDDSANTWNWHVGIDNVELCGFQIAALPIDLVRFDGSDKDCTVELNWEVGNENTTDVFEIERSFDGQIFEVIGRINGSSSSNRFYQFTDTNPGYENFYRLKNTDEAGKVDYSSLKAITANSCKEDKLDIIDIFPNPTKGDLNFNIHSNEVIDVTIEVRNAAGMLVDIVTLGLQVGLNNNTLDTDKLAAGVYYIQLVSDSDASIVRKFIKE